MRDDFREKLRDILSLLRNANHPQGKLVHQLKSRARSIIFDFLRRSNDQSNADLGEDEQCSRVKIPTNVFLFSSNKMSKQC